MIIKFGGGIHHVTHQVQRLLKVKRSRSQGHVTYQQQQRYNSANNSRINFKLGGNYHHGWLITWHAF